MWKKHVVACFDYYTVFCTFKCFIQAKKSQVIEERKVKDFMCHNVQTAVQFYTHNPIISQAMDIQKIITESINSVGGELSGIQKEDRQRDGKEEVEGRGSSSWEEWYCLFFEIFFKLVFSDQLLKYENSFCFICF